MPSFLSRRPLPSLHLSSLACCLSLLITGCGSQMDSIDTPITRPTSAAPAGIYEGTWTSVRDNSSLDVIAFLDGEDRFITFTEDGAFVAAGVYQKQQSNITWRARAYVPSPPPVIDPEIDPEVDPDADPVSENTFVVTTLTAEGGFNADTSLLLSYNVSDGDFGTLSAQYKPLRYEKRSDLPLLAGTWVIEDEFGSATTSFDISQDGAIFGQDGLDGPRDDTCSYAGRFSLITQQYNLYRVTLTRQCRGDESPLPTSGLATLVFDPLTGLPIRIQSVSTSTSIAVVLSLEKS